MKTPPAPVRRPTVAVRFKTEIERAVLDGVPQADLSLHLTLGDIEQLKRDRAVPVEDVSFVGGTMRYLGVEVVKGNVPPSALHRPGAGGE